ncbi:acetyltransferase (GNAT) family protein [Melghirimyces profundicolus]|uniref:Acetyltransferase (GNAT) family protein n=1 Tax=Melghirimyces profundicolus TaxID=1242148 RepID=A0A2T6C4W1_9BACL|nr:GNAT family N-acetyltransferase [Melghirimyces profundicolus]PTX63345.1 acetyltransferase (GNAT) family protein [Melghirimyces profundicolus]
MWSEKVGRERRSLGLKELKARSYRPETDEEAVVAFYLDLMMDHYRYWSEVTGEAFDAGYWEEVLKREKAGEQLARELRNRLDNPDALLLVFICDSDEPIGFLYLEIRKDHLTFRRAGFINGIYLHRDYQGKGLSKQMLARGERWFQERGVAPRHVFVTSNNLAAVKLYASMGYRVSDYRMSKVSSENGL